MQQLPVLFEDNHLLVVDKPAGIATMGAGSDLTVHRLAVEYLRRKYQKPGRVYLGIVSRLDTVTTGVLVLARTSKAASRLVPQFGGLQPGQKPAKKLGVARKFYLAAVSGRLPDDHATLEGFVNKDDAARRMRLTEPSAADAKPAALQYWTVGRTSDATLLIVELLTGRKHQIRVQLADVGHPILGDRKYDSRKPFPNGIALHSWRLQIVHPTRKCPMWFTAQPPPAWALFKSTLGRKNELWKRLALELTDESDE